MARIRALHDVLERAGTTLDVGAHLHKPAMGPAGDVHSYAQVTGGGCLSDMRYPGHEATLTRCDVLGDRIVVRQFTTNGHEISKMVIRP